MNRGIYQILSGALAQELRLHQIAHNTANINTTGFKRGEAIFGSLMAKAGVPASSLRRADSPIGKASQLQPRAVPFVFAHVRDFQTDFSTGRMRATMDPLHLALQQDGFFEVKAPDGLRYTRNGTFHLDSQRRLVTQQGYPVMGSKGELKMPPGRITVGQDGSIAANGRRVGTIKVVTFEDPSQLREVGEATFLGEDAKQVKNPTIASGHIEESNVNPMEEMVKLIEVSRVYESAQKLLQTYDHLADVAISEIGRTA